MYINAIFNTVCTKWKMIGLSNVRHLVLPNASIFFIFNDKKIVEKAFLHSRQIGSRSINRSVAFTYIPQDLRDKCLDDQTYAEERETSKLIIDYLGENVRKLHSSQPYLNPFSFPALLQIWPLRKRQMLIFRLKYCRYKLDSYGKFVNVQ